MSDKPVLIDVKDLVCCYPGSNENALKGISLQIRENDFLAIIGQNGSGKTTLTKHFVGLLRATGGQVTVCGKDAKKTPVVDLAKHVGYVFQNANDQIFCDTVEKEVAYGPKNLKFPKEKLEESVNSALEQMGLTEFRDKHPLNLSWGDRQKVSIAAVLSMGSDIIILDEPTTGQDLLGSFEIMETCRKLHRQGKTIIIITHNMNLVAEFCEKVVVLKEGEILVQGDIKEVMVNADLLKESYIEPPQITMLASQINAHFPGFPDNILRIDKMVEAFSQHSFG